MLLSELLQPLIYYTLSQGTMPEQIEIRELQNNSRRVQPGDLFICLPGTAQDGHVYAASAVRQGAVAILAERIPEGLPEGTPIVLVNDSRRAMAIMADKYYGRPSSRMRLVGVTGTNGKTTVTHMIRDILEANRLRAGLVGTMNFTVGDYIEDTANTTPESVELQRMMSIMTKHDAKYAVLEVSSHALSMGRVRGLDFKTAVFTNLTHDHLDYHETMEKYRESKALLFSQLGNAYDGADPKFAVLNADDPASVYFASQTAAQVVRYGIEQEAELRAVDIEQRPDGSSFTVRGLAGEFRLNLKVPGLFNIYNALAAATAALVEGVPLPVIISTLEQFQGVKGRFQPVYAGQPFTLLIDYAHNPDGLLNVLRSARAFTKGRLIGVVGCEGDRDRPKRPVMGRIAAAESDLAVYTSDNTRSEDPDAIIDMMIEGVADDERLRSKYVAIANRREAIEYAIRQAESPDDCIVICGKGHETVQIVKNNEKIPFDDYVVAGDYIRKLIQEREGRFFGGNTH